MVRPKASMARRADCPPQSSARRHDDAVRRHCRRGRGSAHVRRGHGTGQDPENARHPPPPARTAATARRRASRFCGNARSRPRACSLPWFVSPGLARRGPLPRTACATFGAVSLCSTAPPASSSPTRLPGLPLAHPPPTSPHLSARLRPAALLTYTVGTPIEQRHRHVRGSRAKPDVGGGQAPPESAGALPPPKCR